MCGLRWKLESTLHLFKECPRIIALAFASRWRGRLTEWRAANVSDLIELFLHPSSRVCVVDMDSKRVTIFFASLMYCFWNYCNKSLFDGKTSIQLMGRMLDQFLLEFSEVLHFSTIFLKKNQVEVWSFLARRWWKINCDAAVVKDKTAFSFVVRDDEGLFIMVLTKLVSTQSMYKAKLKAID